MKFDFRPRKWKDVPTGEEMTAEWYLSDGWRKLNVLLTRLASKGIDHAYLSNFDVLPKGYSPNIIAQAFNQDSHSWKLTVENDGDVFAEKIVK